MSQKPYLFFYDIERTTSYSVSLSYAWDHTKHVTVIFPMHITMWTSVHQFLQSPFRWIGIKVSRLNKSSSCCLSVFWMLLRTMDHLYQTKVYCSWQMSCVICNVTQRHHLQHCQQVEIFHFHNQKVGELGITTHKLTQLFDFAMHSSSSRHSQVSCSFEGWWCHWDRCKHRVSFFLIQQEEETHSEQAKSQNSPTKVDGPKQWFLLAQWWSKPYRLCSCGCHGS